MVGMIVLALCTFWLPWLANDAAEMNPTYAYLRFPVLIGLNITAIPFFLALYQAFKLLKYIDSEYAFSQRSVKSLGHIKNYAMIIIFLYGESHYEGRDMGMGEYIAYVDRDSKRYICFWFKEGKVREIEWMLI